MKVRSDFFSKAELDNIHAMTVRVLENVGVIMEDEYALELFRKHGAKVDGDRVYISEALLNKALSTVPEEFKIYGRNDKFVTIGGDHCVIAPVSGPLFVRRGNEQHRNTAEDYKNFQKMHHTSKVMDMLNPNLIEPSDIDRSIVRDYQMAVCLKYTDKPLIGLTTAPDHTVNSIEMTQKFYGRKENVLLGIISVISPLKYDKTMLEAAKICAERSQPMMIACCSMPGATSPVTMSGTIVVNNAEVLAGIVYTQLLRPGIPVLYGNTTGGCDLRYVGPSIGSPETALFIFGAAALAKYYHIPCRTGGALADAKTVDWQAGVESTITMLPALMSSSNYILHSCGVMDSFNVLSYEKFLLDEQNIALLRKLVNGVEVRTDEEEFEVIQEAGPGGQYLESDHTMDYMHEEIYTPRLFNKMGYDAWEKQGCKTAEQVAEAQIDARIAAYEPVEVTPEQDKILESYIGDLIQTI